MGRGHPLRRADDHPPPPGGPGPLDAGGHQGRAGPPALGGGVDGQHAEAAVAVDAVSPLEVVAGLEGQRDRAEEPAARLVLGHEDGVAGRPRPAGDVGQGEGVVVADPRVEGPVGLHRQPGDPGEVLLRCVADPHAPGN